MGEKILEIENLKKKYDSGFELNIPYAVFNGNRVNVLIGPNGSGKSTLIRILNMLEKPDNGKIIFRGSDVYSSKTSVIEARKKMAAVFQEPLLFNISVYSNIVLGLNLRKIKISSKKEVFDFLVRKLKLENLLDRNPKSLSGGEQQRTALARALILEPEVLLLDEPLANIDQLSKEEIRSDLFEILKQIGRCTIYVTHDRNEAMIIADEVIVMNEGKIEQSGEKNIVFRKPANEFVARFVGVETLLDGVVIKQEGSLCSIKINGAVIYSVSDAKIGDNVMVSIRPEDVIIFSTEIADDESSALNRFDGIITEITDIGIFKKIEIDCGFKLCAFITQNSIHRMSLEAGRKVKAAVKASSIHLFKA